MTDIARLGIQVDSDGAIKAATDLDKLTKTGKKAETQTKRLATASRQTRSNFRLMRGGAQQLSFQLQDIAVQAQAGTNAFIILGQQGPQLASVFGPGGAVFGAVIALSAALAGTLYNSLKDTTAALEDVGETADTLLGRFDELEGGARKAAMALALLRRETKLEEIKAYKKEIERINAEIERGNVVGRKGGFLPSEITVPFSAAAVKERQDQITELRAAMEAAQLDADKLLSIGRGELPNEAGDKPPKPTTTSRATSPETLRSLEFAAAIAAEEAFLQQQAKMREGQERKELAAAERGLAQVRAALATRGDLLDAFYADRQSKLEAALSQGLVAETEAMNMSLDLEKRRIEAQQQNAQIAAGSIVALTGVLTSQLGSLFGEASAVGKAFFVINQSIAAADAIIKGLQTAAAVRLAYAGLAAATANPGLLAAGEAHANVATALGFATAGAIAGQTIASFEGGGFTGPGSRSGGLDGRGGKLAVLHPNEKVTDLTQRGDATTVNVTIQANDTRGFDNLLRSRRGEIIKIINTALNNRGRESIA